MASVVELELEMVAELARIAVMSVLEESENALGVLPRIQRFDFAVAGVDAEQLAAELALVDEGRVFFLQERGVSQHVVAEVGGGGSGMDSAAKAGLAERG